jgi:3,4-dihydroxy-2-butanone 4-phosphate synthase
MKLLKKEDVIDEQQDLPKEDEEDVVVSKQTDRERELELELAEQRGENKALKALRAKGDGNSNQPMSIEQTKNLVFTDSNNLSDEDFKKKYNQTKHGAIMTVMDADNRQTKTEAKNLHAEAIAVSELSSRIGSDFYKFKDQILEEATDLSESARQDPAKLKRWMEGRYAALSTTMPTRKSSTDDRRKVVADFEPPTRKEEAPIKKEAVGEIEDEVPAESDISNRVLAKHMGITTKEEQKKYGSTPYVDMDLGGGYRFSDPKRGFEKVEQKVA